MIPLQIPVHILLTTMKEELIFQKYESATFLEYARLLQTFLVSHTCSVYVSTFDSGVGAGADTVFW